MDLQSAVWGIVLQPIGKPEKHSIVKFWSSYLVKYILSFQNLYNNNFLLKDERREGRNKERNKEERKIRRNREKKEGIMKEGGKKKEKQETLK